MASPSSTSFRNNQAPLPMPAKIRLNRELTLLSTEPPPGISCYTAPPSSTSTTEAPTLTHLHATITGPPSTPFQKGIFLLNINIPRRYPFEPPKIRFLTPIYHPNIDSSGRICLDTLKSPPSGSWSPAVSLPTLLLTIRTLMGEPNAEDGLVPEVTDLFRRDYKGWWNVAEGRVKREATEEKLIKLQDALSGLSDKNRKCPDGKLDSEDLQQSNGGNKRKSPAEAISTLNQRQNAERENENTRDVRTKFSSGKY